SGVGEPEPKVRDAGRLPHRRAARLLQDQDVAGPRRLQLREARRSIDLHGAEHLLVEPRGAREVAYGERDVRQPVGLDHQRTLITSDRVMMNVLSLLKSRTSTAGFCGVIISASTSTG